MSDQLPDHLFKSLCQNAGIAMIATDKQLCIRFWNKVAQRLFGGSADERLGKPLLSVVSEDRRGLLERALRRALRRSAVSEFEVRYPDPAGRSRYLAVTISPIKNDYGAPAGVSVCVRDVTYGMELLRDVAEAQRMSALGSMAGAIAHHFNNLLGGVMTAIDFAQDANNPDLNRRALSSTADATARVKVLTHSLLAFAEGDRSESPDQDVTETIRQFIETHKSDWADLDISVEAELDPVGLVAATRRILSILEVLSANAREAMLDGGTLRFELKGGEPGMAVLKVSDTGVGIPPEQLRHVFEPFFSTKRSHGLGREGHPGLGLAVVYGIVKDLGGKAVIEPRDEGGTACSIHLPIAKKNKNNE